MTATTPNLSVKLAGITLKNPILTASGTFGYGLEFAELVDLNALGGITTKGIYLKPKMGNPPQRIAETRAGMLNAIGLENVGVDVFLNEKLPKLRAYDVPIFVNISDSNLENYCKTAERLARDGDGVSAIELNISCPNVEKGGIEFGTDPQIVERITRDVKAASGRLPLFVKLTPNVTDIRAIARAAEQGGADGLSIMNTILGMAIDVRTRKPKLANRVGGLSGPAVKPIAVRMVWQVAKVVQIPIIGMGGVMNAEDAVEFMLAGATAVAVGTANFIDPTISVKIIEGLRAFCKEHDIADIRTIIGTVDDGER